MRAAHASESNRAAIEAGDGSPPRSRGAFALTERLPILLRAWALWGIWVHVSTQVVEIDWLFRAKSTMLFPESLRSLARRLGSGSGTTVAVNHRPGSMRLMIIPRRFRSNFALNELS